MRPFAVQQIQRFSADLTLLGDKSIAHRALIISALSSGRVRIENFPASNDCLATFSALKKLGVRIKKEKPESKASFFTPLKGVEKYHLYKQGLLTGFTLTVCGRGLSGLKKAGAPISAGESGTTFRLLLGVLAGQPFKTKLTAAGSLSLRPMRRVTVPLRMMGAKIKSSRFKVQGSRSDECPPIIIEGGRLRGITYHLPVASAQVKSAILLAGLYAKSRTTVIEPVRTRDHTERMLKLFKADIKRSKKEISLCPGRKLVSPGGIYIPADISSAAFFMVLAAILPRSQVIIRRAGLNPLRAGIIRALKKMGAKIKSEVSSRQPRKFEPAGSIKVSSSKLQGVTIRRTEVPSLIDELPVLMVAACLAKGRSVFEGVGELRVKEADRIKSMLDNLKKMGADIKTAKAGKSEKIIIHGKGKLIGAKVKSFGDHRTAMSMIVAGLAAEGRTLIDDISCIDKSFPGFIRLLTKGTQESSHPNSCS